MLVELKVTNFAIIDNIHIHFLPGLNILSGETGAGKSVLLKSLALLMGEKATGDSIRTGSEQATIEGRFDLSKRKDILSELSLLGIDISEENLVVRRVVNSQGKSRVYMNGSLCTLQDLKQMVAPMVEVAGATIPLIEMTGQHDSRHLLSRNYHLDMVDSYCGNNELRNEFSRIYGEHKSVMDKIVELQDEARNREQRLDFLKYQREEIKAMDLQVDEEVQLESEVKRQKNAARLLEFVEFVESVVHGDEDSCLVRIHKVLQRGAEVSPLDAGLEKYVQPLGQAKAILEDVVYEIRDYGKKLGGEAESLDSLEGKLSQFRKLQKKYGTSVREILDTLQAVEQEIEQVQNSDETLKELKIRKEQLEKEMSKLAKQLHARRKEGATLLQAGVNDELADLNMKGLEFHVHIEELSDFGPTGKSMVEFLSRTSKKDEPRPLAKFASGGELSRILLSLKSVIGQSDIPRSYLFDEVDTGVSGETAEKVGRKLKAISEGQQVLCVTHLPQVACFADHHFLISKKTVGRGVQMEVKELKSSDRVQEIARMISGEKITKTSLDHAKNLLELN